MYYEKVYDKTPNGGDYSEAWYRDDEGKPADSSVATVIHIHECKADGTIISTVTAFTKNKFLKNEK